MLGLHKLRIGQRVPGESPFGVTQKLQPPKAVRTNPQWRKDDIQPLQNAREDQKWTGREALTSFPQPDLRKYTLIAEMTCTPIDFSRYYSQIEAMRRWSQWHLRPWPQSPSLDSPGDTFQWGNHAVCIGDSHSAHP